VERVRNGAAARAAFHARPLRPLVTVVTELAREAPALEVVEQTIQRGPHAAGIAPPLGRDDELLVRITGYRLGEQRVSRHGAYVDLVRLDPALAASLREGRTDLGRLFSEHRAQKSDAAVGDDRDAPAECAPLVAALGDARLFLWRRYAASLAGLVIAVVLEVVPVGEPA
jgi:hypothetical protein